MTQKSKNYQIVKTEQRSEEWFAMREGLVTGSVAERVKTKSNSYVYEVVATMITNSTPSDYKSPAMQWGEENEPKAREAYTKKTGHTVEELGFITNGRLGLSPDGVVMKKNEIVRAVEIKCPDTKTHVKYCLEGVVPKEYMAQIIHYFVVIDDLEVLDFVSFDPRAKVRPLFIKTITRDALGAEIEVAKVAYTDHLNRLDDAYKQMIL